MSSDPSKGKAEAAERDNDNNQKDAEQVAEQQQQQQREGEKNVDDFDWQFVDVLHELGRRGVVDADSLIARFCLDSDDTDLSAQFGALAIDWQHGGQLLHLLYATERFLADFVSRACHLTVVFFGHGASVLPTVVPEERKQLVMLFRELLKKHLQRFDSGVEVVEAESWWSEEWRRDVVQEHAGWLMAMSRHSAWSEFVKQHVHLEKDVVAVERIELKGKGIHAWMVPGFKTERPAPTVELNDFAPVPQDAASDERVKSKASDLEAEDAAFVAAVVQANAEAEDGELYLAILLAYFAARKLPLKYRAQALPNTLSALTKRVEAGISRVAGALIRRLASLERVSLLLDAFDGRLVHRLFVSGAKAGAEGLSLSAIPFDPAALGLPAKFKPDLKVEAAADVKPKAVEQWPVMPFSEHFLRSVVGDNITTLPSLSIDDAAVTEVVGSNRKFLEDHHWHNGKPLRLGEPERKVEEKKTKREMKREMKYAQKQAAHIEKIAESLLGKHVQPQTVICNQKPTKLKSTAKSQKIQAEKMRKKREAEISKQMKDWEREESKVLKDLSVDKILKFIDGLHEPVQLHILVRATQHLLAQRADRVMIARVVFEVYKRNAEQGVKLLRKAGFDDLADRAEGKERRLEEGSGNSGIRFQLERMGPYLVREEGERDERIEHFNPDAWQQKLLDVVDKKESALVVAPTSSGKTFIAYYVMKSVLTESDDGCVVYVAPTKALVNQVFAGVHARYNKVYKYADSGMAVAGIFTRDWRQLDDRCQVLVTVPQCLDILLLSPSPAQQRWVKNLKYIIFDEVHGINDPEVGGVWERLLQVTRCPFIALSATVGEPERFHQWLDRDDRKTHLIVHPHRWNHLRHSTVTSLDPLKVQVLHPLATVTPAIARLGLPDTLDFEAADAVRLYDAMRRFDAESMAALEPDTFFKDAVVLSVVQERRYTDAVCARFEEWCRSRDRDEQVQEILAAFAEPLEQTVVVRPTEANILEVVTQISQHLKETRVLPALFFCFDRYLIEYLATSLAQKFAERERAYLEAPAEKKKRERLKEQLGVAKAAYDKAVVSYNRLRNPTLPQRKELESTLEAVTSIQAKLDAYKNDPRFSTRVVGQGDATEREEQIKRIMWKTKWDREHPLLQALDRGIGAHHAGLPTAYRQAVEILFRLQDLPVCFATGTLAQGVHMPCKSVVFAADSIFLNPLTFRQMSGRAGRRGHDVLGRIYFAGIRKGKIQRLLNSPLPYMRGSFPFTASIVLRLVMLYDAVRRKKSQSNRVLDMLRRLCQLNLLSSSGSTDNSDSHLGQLKHYFRFALEFLMREGVLSPGIDEDDVSALTSDAQAKKEKSAAKEAEEKKKKEEEEQKKAAAEAEEKKEAEAAAGKEEAGAEQEEEDDGAAMDAWDDWGDGNLDALLGNIDTSAPAPEPKKEEKKEEEGPKTTVLSLDGAAEQKKPAVSAAQQEALALVPGAPLGLAGLVTHLSWLEPGNLALLHIMRDGLLQRVCSDNSLNPEQKAEKLLAYTACVVSPKPIHDTKIALRRKTGHGSLILQEVPEEVQASLRRYNAKVVQLFTQYVIAVSQVESEEELPLSGAVGVSVGGDDAELAKQLGLTSHAIPYSARSPFAATSGLGDDFEGVDDLIHTTRSSIYLDSSMIPTVFLPKWINAFITDFYKHGNIKEIRVANGLKNGWHELKTVMLVLQTIATSLVKLEEQESERVLDANMFRFLQDMKEEMRGEPAAIAISESKDVAKMYYWLAKKFSAVFNGTRL